MSKDGPRARRINLIKHIHNQRRSSRPTFGLHLVFARIQIMTGHHRLTFDGLILQPSTKGVAFYI